MFAPSHCDGVRGCRWSQGHGAFIAGGAACITGKTTEAAPLLDLLQIVVALGRVVVGELRPRCARALGDQHVEVVFPAGADVAYELRIVEVLDEGERGRVSRASEQELEMPAAVVVLRRYDQAVQRWNALPTWPWNCSNPSGRCGRLGRFSKEIR